MLETSAQYIASYSGDWANSLTLFDATVETLTADGGRKIAFADLHILPHDHPEQETILGDDELITGYRLQIPDWALRLVFVKAHDRESCAFVLASAAVALAMDGDTVREARLSLGGVAIQGAQGFGHDDFKTP